MTLGKTQLGAGIVAKSNLIKACMGRIHHKIVLTDERDLNDLKNSKTNKPKFGEEYALAWAIKNELPDLVKVLYELDLDINVKDVYTDLNIL